MKWTSVENLKISFGVIAAKIEEFGEDVIEVE